MVDSPALALDARCGARRRVLLLAALLLLCAAAPASAAFPDRPVRLIVPFAPGGGTDIIARAVGAGMAADLGQPVVIDNKPGAGTVVGTAAAANAMPDGTTLAMATFAYAVNPSLKASLPYDTLTAFAPVTLIARSYNVVVVRPQSGFATLGDLLAYARANPGKLNYGSFGVGTSAHLAAELLKHLAGVDLTHVAYKGSAPALTDLLGGEIQLMVTTVSSVAQHLESGQLRALAVTAPARSPAYPEVPTVAEAGVPGYVAESWYGLLAPAGTPHRIVARLRQAVVAAVKIEPFQRLVAGEGLTVVAGPPEELDSYVRAEAARWRDVVKAARIQPD